MNILSIGTGIEEHARYAVDFIEAVKWIKANLPGALTSGGVSNLSFAFRGNNTVREAMHSAFLYHAIKAGLDMAIVNPSMLQIYDEIEPELLKGVEDVIFNRDPQATERLIEKATAISAAQSLSNTGTSGNNTAGSLEHAQENSAKTPVSQRLQNSLIKGRSENLESDLLEALSEYGTAGAVIEGPLMAGMEAVGKLFGDGKMFLPQVVKSAKVMRDMVSLLEPYLNEAHQGRATRVSEMFGEHRSSDGTRPERSERSVCPSGLPTQEAGGRKRQNTRSVVLATVKGDVHDIGKNITGIVLTCNGFDVHDLGVMVDKETILDEAERQNADMVAVSGLITPSLYQMEELCREMAARGMTTPLMIGGATTSALHTAVKLAPIYDHVFYGADASAAAVLAKKCMMDRETFEAEQHAQQQKLRDLYYKTDSDSDRQHDDSGSTTHCNTTKFESNIVSIDADASYEVQQQRFNSDTYLTDCPADFPVQEIPLSEVLPYFDWRMFYAIWGVKYGSSSPEAMELIQLRRDAEDELAVGDFKIMLGARFFPANTDGHNICFSADGNELKLPMMRQEGGKNLSLADFVIPAQSGRKSPFGMFAVCVHKKSKAHVHGCSCPACSNAYEDMIGKAVRLTLAEAASLWLDNALQVGGQLAPHEGSKTDSFKKIKPAIGYSSCPDHTLKELVLKLLDDRVHHYHTHSANCSCSDSESHKVALGIELTESYAMTPEASICGLVFMHPEAEYPQIRNISQKQYDDYVKRRNMDAETARRFLGHLLK